MRRFDAEYVALRKLIADGGLGNPLMVHCTHRNPAVGDHFNSEFMIRDSVVHEVDAVRFLLDEEITSVQVIRGVPTGDRSGGDQRPDAGDLRDRVRPDRHRRGLRADPGGVRGAHRGGRREGLAPSSDWTSNMQVKSADGRWGGAITPGFVERFGAAYDTELQRWVDAARPGTIDGPGAWDGYAAVAVCEAGVEALRTGQKVDVPSAGSAAVDWSRRAGDQGSRSGSRSAMSSREPSSNDQQGVRKNDHGNDAAPLEGRRPLRGQRAAGSAT